MVAPTAPTKVVSTAGGPPAGGAAGCQAAARNGLLPTDRRAARGLCGRTRGRVGMRNPEDAGDCWQLPQDLVRRAVAIEWLLSRALDVVYTRFRPDLAKRGATGTPE